MRFGSLRRAPSRRAGRTYDREILRLAVPALFTLAAEPLYVLVDTAIVGHLGSAQLAALGAAATVLSVVTLFSFLQYGTTAQVARALGAKAEDDARRLGAQALWLSAGIGIVLAAALAVSAGFVVDALGVSQSSSGYAVTYLRIVSLGLPFVFVALGGQGFLRGAGDLVTPLRIVVAANVLNAVLEVLFVYGFEWGIEGSAWGTVVAQAVMGIGIAAAVVRGIGRRMLGFRRMLALRLLHVGLFILLRTLALIAAFVLSGAVAARSGDAELAAFHVGFQLFLLMALVLDAVAIAGQIIVGRELGAGRTEGAFSAGMRMVEVSVGVGVVLAAILLAGTTLLPRIFTSDVDVLHQCRLLWPFLALVLPAAGAVFALDGVLIGASDGWYLAFSMACAFVACACVSVVTLAFDLGTRGIWTGLVVLVLVRLVLMAERFRRRRWLVTGYA